MNMYVLNNFLFDAPRSSMSYVMSLSELRHNTHDTDIFLHAQEAKLSVGVLRAFVCHPLPKMDFALQS